MLDAVLNAVPVPVVAIGADDRTSTANPAGITVNRHCL
jgi:hypothetical protein